VEREKKIVVEREGSGEEKVFPHRVFHVSSSVNPEKGCAGVGEWKKGMENLRRCREWSSHSATDARLFNHLIRKTRLGGI
jgi:hypothetical protein